MRTQIKEKIKEVQDEIVIVVKLLYQERESRTYEHIDKLLVALIELNTLVTEAIQQGEEIFYEEEKFKGALLEAMEAVHKKDMTLFADILQYEIKEQIQEWIK